MLGCLHLVLPQCINVKNQTTMWNSTLGTFSGRHEETPKLKLGLRVVLTARRRHLGIENLTLVKMVRFG